MWRIDKNLIVSPSKNYKIPGPLKTRTLRNLDSVKPGP